jgi:hypothetical protein
MKSSQKTKATPSSKIDLGKWSIVPPALIAVGGLGVLIGLAFPGLRMQLGYSYLLAFMFFLSLCLGGLFLVMIHHLFDAYWSVPIRRYCEHIAFLLPVMAVLFIPLAILAPTIYPWMALDPNIDHALEAKHALVNKPAFYLISILLFAIWTVLSYHLRYWSLEQDKTGAAICTRKMRIHSAWGIFAFGLTLTMAAVLWMKTLQHQFFSTMYGVYYFAGSIWLSMATFYVIALALKKAGPLRDVVRERQFHDLGVLFFAFTVFYAYIHFSQYFLIWNAAIPEETFWYVLREKGSWWDIGMIIVFGHFFVPFLLLLRIDAKLYFPLMLALAAWAWFMHYLDMAYNIIPVHQVYRNALAMPGELSHNLILAVPDGFALHPLDFACVAFIGGVLAFMFVRYFNSHAPFPQKDPRMAETLGVYVPLSSEKTLLRGGGK